MPATITAIAHYVPPEVITNSFFEEYLDTSSDWIMSRTGIKERHFLKEGGTSQMVIPAAKDCLEQRGITADEIDLIIVCTVTPDHMFPSTASIVQTQIGASNAWGFDMEAACSGFLFGLANAKAMVESGVAKKVLLCGADKMSSIVNMNDRSQAILFGDAAGVCIVEESDDPESGILDMILNMDGSGKSALNMKSGGSFSPPTKETVENKEHYIFQDGQAVFKAAVKGMADVSLEIMEKNNIDPKDIAWLVPHQANMRIITATANRMGIEREQVMINIERYGNTTAATIPMAISEWYHAGKVNKGDNLVLSSFGAGFAWGAILLKWNMNK
jgi:3-oxoacyl-[acyl-carrier-protein] synthase III